MYVRLKTLPIIVLFQERFGVPYQLCSNTEASLCFGTEESVCFGTEASVCFGTEASLCFGLGDNTGTSLEPMNSPSSKAFESQSLGMAPVYLGHARGLVNRSGSGCVAGVEEVVVEVVTGVW